MGELSVRKLPSFVSIGQDAKIRIYNTSNDEKPIRLVNKSVDFIPQCQRFSSTATISIAGSEAIEKLVAGSYKLIDDEEIGSLAINYNRNESSVQVMNEKEIVTAFKNAGIKNCTFKAVDNGQSTTQLKLDKPSEYWRYFIVLAIIFVLIEMILIKYWK